MIKPHTTFTAKQLPVVFLLDDKGENEENVILLKAYPNEKGTKLRLVIPSLKSFKQALVNIDQHYIEVDL